MRELSLIVFVILQRIAESGQRKVDRAAVNDFPREPALSLALVERFVRLFARCFSAFQTIFHQIAKMVSIRLPSLADIGIINPPDTTNHKQRETKMAKTYENSRDFEAAAKRRHDALYYGGTNPQWMKDRASDKAARDARYLALRASGMEPDAAFDTVAVECGVLSSRLTLDAYDNE